MLTADCCPEFSLSPVFTVCGTNQNIGQKFYSKAGRDRVSILSTGALHLHTRFSGS